MTQQTKNLVKEDGTYYEKFATGTIRTVQVFLQIQGSNPQLANSWYDTC